jgi:RNA polymerase sigma factor (sigma-70 family)
MDARCDDLDHESACLRRARRGDNQAFEQLYVAHAKAIHTLALRLTGHHAAAEDIVQETFLRMFGFLSDLRDDTPLRPWLKRVASNLAIDRIRREHRYAGDETVWQTESADPSPPSSTEALAFLQRLAPLARTLVWLHAMEGWSHTELARRFGRSESWSKSILSRSLARLREELETGEIA